MINPTFVKKKLELLEKYHKELNDITNLSVEQIRKDFIRYYAAERVFQLIVDEMIDVNNHILKYGDFETLTPDDFQSTFLKLGENQVLPEEFARKIAPRVGLRNRLVHRYEEIDRGLFLKTVRQEKEDFRQYVKFIYEYIQAGE